jgi:hypothetical protein
MQVPVVGLADGEGHVRGQRSGIRGQVSEVRYQRPEARGQRTVINGVGNQRSQWEVSGGDFHLITDY